MKPGGVHTTERLDPWTSSLNALEIPSAGKTSRK